MHSSLRLCLAFSSVLAAAGAAFPQGNGPWTQVCNLSTSGTWSSQSGVYADISHDARYVAFVSGWFLDPADTNGWGDVYVRDLHTSTTFAASLGQGGVWGDHAALEPALSSTGRYVAFQSGATNLVPGNDPGFDPDVFLRDIVTGTTVRCSIGAGGVEPNSGSYKPDVSGDGRYVSFVSAATNLLPNPSGYRQVFVYDRITGALEMASSDSSGTPGVGHSYQYRSALSGDGRYCVFDTFASFTAGDTNGTVDIYRKDLVSGQIELVSALPATGLAGSNYSEYPSISSDGRFVAFDSFVAFAANDTNGQIDVYVRDMAGSAVTLMSVDMLGVAANGGEPEISADGKHVAFRSASSTYVPNDNNTFDDIFVRDWALGQTTRESVSYAGGDANFYSATPSISGNGRRLVFLSQATNLVQGVDPNSTNPDCYARDRGPSATPQVYCIAKVNSLGCTPAIGFSGVPSATNANAFHITASNIVSHKFAVLFYSKTGPTLAPFQGGYLCAQPPTVRYPQVLDSGGTPNVEDCTGAFDVNFNAYIAGGADPALQVPGQEFWAQFWSRDPPSPFTTNLTDALDAVVQL